MRTRERCSECDEPTDAPVYTDAGIVCPSCDEARQDITEQPISKGGE